MKMIPFSRPESEHINILSVSFESGYLLNGSCENQTDIYSECYYQLDTT